MNAGTFFALTSILISSMYLYEITKEPDQILDSMLCNKHVPVGTMLVTDRIISCTNGKRYEVIK
jgi:hypothetical protein